MKMPKCKQSSNSDGGKANIPMVGIWLSIEKQCVTQPLPNTWKQKISRLKDLIYPLIGFGEHSPQASSFEKGTLEGQNKLFL